MAREPFTPTAEDIWLLSEHLWYEVFMTFSLALFFAGARGTVPHRVTHDAELEAFTVHVRQLIEFFWSDRSKNPASEDAFALDYFAPGEWDELCPPRPAILDEALRRKVGWGVAHLTYERGRVTPEDKLWDTTGLARGLAPAVLCFADNVDPAKMKPQHLQALRPLAESVLPPRPPTTSTATSS